MPEQKKIVETIGVLKKEGKQMKSKNNRKKKFVLTIWGKW